MQAATYTELSGLTFTCTPEDVAAGCSGSGDDYLAALGFAGTDVWRLCGYLVAEAAIVRVLAFYALHFLYTGQPAGQRLRALLC